MGFKVCPYCGIMTSDLSRHLRRLRCAEQHRRHIRKNDGKVVKL